MPLHISHYVKSTIKQTSGGKFAIGRYALSPIAKGTGTKNCFRYQGVIDHVELDMERPTDDMDLMLELEHAQNTE